MTGHNLDALRQQITESLSRHKASAAQFRKAKTASELHTALDALSGIDPADTENLQKAYQLIRDPKENVVLRLKAISKVINALFDDEDAVSDFIKLVSDQKQPVEIRRAALYALKAISFSSPALTAKKAAYMQALRGLVDSADPELRQPAIEKLAASKDEGVQQRLLEGLKDPGKALLPEEKAIQLLGLDIRAEHYPVIRERLTNSTNPLVQQEAIHALSADPGSQDLIRQRVQDRKSDKRVRLAGIAALNAFNALQFQPTLQSLITDETEDHDIRTASLNMLTLHPDLEAVYKDEAFTKAVEALQYTGNADLHRLSHTYLVNQARAAKK